MNSHGRIRSEEHEWMLLWEKPPSPPPSSASPSINLTRVLSRSWSSRNRLTSIFAISIWQTLDITVTSKKCVCARRLVSVLASIYLFTTGFCHLFRVCFWLPLMLMMLTKIENRLWNCRGKEPTKTGVFLPSVEMNFNHNIQWYRERDILPCIYCL